MKQQRSVYHLCAAQNLLIAEARRVVIKRGDYAPLTKQSTHVTVSSLYTSNRTRVPLVGYRPLHLTRAFLHLRKWTQVFQS